MAADFILQNRPAGGVQSYALDRWLTPGRPFVEIMHSYNRYSQSNLLAKLNNHLDFVDDVRTVPAVLVLALLAGILTLALVRAARRAD